MSGKSIGSGLNEIAIELKYASLELYDKRLNRQALKNQYSANIYPFGYELATLEIYMISIIQVLKFFIKIYLNLIFKLF